MNQKYTKALAEGAICTALAVLLMTIAIYVPVFGLFAIAVAGLPMVFLGTRHGIKITVLAMVAAILSLCILTADVVAAGLFGVLYLLPGVMIGFSISHRWGFRRTVFLASAGVLIGFMLQFLVLNLSAGGEGFVQMLDDMLESSRQALVATIEQIGQDDGTQFQPVLESLNEIIAGMRQLILLYLPTAVIAMAATMGYLATAFAIFMLRRVRVAKVLYLPFWQLRASRTVCYLSVGLSLIPMLMGTTGVYSAAFQNMAVLIDCFLGVCGLALIDDKLRAKISSGYVRGGIYAAVFVFGYILMGILGQILVFLGFLDGLFDFRRIRKVGEDHGKNK